MSHLITFVRREGQEPITVNAPGYDEPTARTMAGALAALCRRVTLSRVDDDGIPEPIQRWANGKSARGLPGKTIPPVEPTVIDHEDENIQADAAAADDADLSIAEAAAASDEESETHEAYCMKCHEKRNVTGTVELSANGRRQFRGPCPVCATNVFRFLPNEAQPVLTDTDADYETPDEEADEFVEAEPSGDESEEFVEDEAPAEDIPGIVHILQKDTAPRGKVRLFCACDEWESVVKPGTAAETRAVASYSEHAAEAEDPEEESDTAAEIIEAVAAIVPEGTPVAEMAEAAEVAAVEFSHAAKEAETVKPAKKAPAKRASKRAIPVEKDANGRTPNQRAAANPTLGFCPSCESNEVPIIERAGLKIYTVHGDQKRGLDRCNMSTAQVPGS